MTTPPSDSPPVDHAPDGTDPDDGQGVDEHTDADNDQGDGQGTPDNDTDDGQARSEEAKRYRVRLREAERLLSLTRQSVVDRAVNAAKLDPRLMIAAGHTTDSFVNEDGLIDHDALADAIADTKREFRVSPGLLPNAQQGTGGGPAHGATSWGQAYREAKQR